MPLNYVPETWEDEELADVALYDILDSEDAPINEDVKINLATDVVVAGTGVTAERMNHIEQGIADASDLVDRMTVPATALTIVANEITITQDNHYLASGSSGDIETISGIEAGQEVKLYMEDFGVDSVTFKHGVDNISCAGGADVDFSNGAIFLTSDGVTVFVSGGGGGGVVGIADGGTGQTTAGAALDALTVEGANIAAAATTNIGAGTGRVITITGNTTITAFDNVTAGRIRVLKFTGTPLLTYNAVSLKLPNAANYQVVAGDVFTFESEGSGNWKCIGYVLASGKSINQRGALQEQGAKLTWNSVSGYQLEAGEAEVNGKLLSWGAAITRSSLSLSNSTLYNVYLYDNSGTPAIEESTTSPVWDSTLNCYKKTGDNTRRWMGWLTTNASGQIRTFLCVISGRSIEMFFTDGDDVVTGGKRIVAGGTTTGSWTSVSLSPFVPVNASHWYGQAKIANDSGDDGVAGISPIDLGSSIASTAIQAVRDRGAAAGVSTFFGNTFMPIQTAQTFYWRLQIIAGTPELNIEVQGARALR